MSEEPQAEVEQKKSTTQKVTQTAQQARKYAQMAQKAGQALQQVAYTVFNPYFWLVVGIVLLVVVLILVIVAGIQLIGRTENADGCFGIGDTNISITTSEDGDKNIQSIMAWMTSTNFEFMGGKAMTKEQAAGVAGNMKVESHGLPNIIQPSLEPTEKSNDEVRSLGGVSGRAVGLVQWDAERRNALLDFAEEKGKKWSDLDLQLEYLKKELDGGEGSNLAAAGFAKEGKSAADYAELWNRAFERSNDYSSERGDIAEQVARDFTGGSYTADSQSSNKSGGSCVSSGDGGGSLDTSDAAKLAKSMSYPVGDEDVVGAGDSYGEKVAKQEYKDAKKKAQEEAGADPMPTLYASCDRFVATVTKLTMDKDIPWGPTDAQYAYLKGSSKWEEFSKLSEAKPGDILVTRGNGHIMMYLGNQDGQNLVAHASYMDRVAGLDVAESVMSENLTDTMGRQFSGYHFKG